MNEALSGIVGILFVWTTALVIHLTGRLIWGPGEREPPDERDL